MKIAIERTRSTGVWYHRQLMQHIGMDFVFIEPGEPIPNDADIFITNDRAALRFHSRCKVVVDVDDYPVPPPHHILAGAAKMGNQKARTIKWCHTADAITTTTDILAYNIERLTGRTATVLPNAIDLSEPQFCAEKTKPMPDKALIGFVGGSTHEHDLKLIRHAVRLLYEDQEYNQRFTFVYAGYDSDISVVNQHGKPLSGYVSPHVKAEQMFSNNEPVIPIKNNDAKSISERYYRRYAQAIYNYGRVYSILDAAIAPLENHRFNQCKSELKFIEAAAFGVPLLCSDVGAYSHLENVVRCNTTADWLQAFKDVIDGVNLPNPTEEANQKFNINKIREQRMELYKSLLNG